LIINKKKTMNSQHKIILKVLEEYLEKYPTLRFGQALYNLNIMQWEEPFDPHGKNVMRDIHSDSDIKILERIKLPEDDS